MAGLMVENKCGMQIPKPTDLYHRHPTAASACCDPIYLTETDSLRSAIDQLHCQKRNLSTYLAAGHWCGGSDCDASVLARFAINDHGKALFGSKRLRQVLLISQIAILSI